ncbi:ABC transporter permease [Schaalia cardiffensis]
MTTATVKAQQPTNPVAAFIKSNMQLVMVLIALVIIYAYFMFAAPNFAQPKIFTDILLQAAYIGVMALGATFVIATAGIDLSVGTGMTLVAVMAGVFLSADWMNLPLGVGLILVLLFGAFIGLINGVNVSILGLPPFIATLAMMMVARGLALIISDKSTISIANKDYIALSTGTLFPSVGGATLTNAALIFVLLTILAAFLLSKTLLGRYALAIGSNEEATRLSGVNVRLWKVIIYVVAGVFMAIGAILYSARFGFVQPAEGVGFELNVIAATVIGGTSLSGGRASIPGALLGALIMETLKKGLTMMGVASEWQLVVTGVVVLLAVFIDNIRRARENAA